LEKPTSSNMAFSKLAKMKVVRRFVNAQYVICNDNSELNSKEKRPCAWINKIRGAVGVDKDGKKANTHHNI
jgi:hypothetical protein